MTELKYQVLIVFLYVFLENIFWVGFYTKTLCKRIKGNSYIKEIKAQMAAGEKLNHAKIIRMKVESSTKRQSFYIRDMGVKTPLYFANNIILFAF